ncbi:hypothetical protein BN1232_05109 [Mycobacterium lentiflavum]|uniref:Uncharacterized protein n=1 Tax=Mycobacterium lentiflavum TaxID=141349 RepID=A0A0E4CQK4_MYCLN|nr:hypothetical protein BN1232_05109 [Mycobacterium lentiflavum]
MRYQINCYISAYFRPILGICIRTRKSRTQRTARTGTTHTNWHHPFRYDEFDPARAAATHVRLSSPAGTTTEAVHASSRADLRSPVDGGHDRRQS